MTTWVNTPEGRGRVTEYQSAQHGGHVHVAGDGFEGWYRVAEVDGFDPAPVSYTHLTLPTIALLCRSRWSPYN